MVHHCVMGRRRRGREAQNGVICGVWSGSGVAAGREAVGLGSARWRRFWRAALPAKGKRLARPSAAGNRRIWETNLSGMANKLLKNLALFAIDIAV